MRKPLISLTVIFTQRVQKVINSIHEILSCPFLSPKSCIGQMFMHKWLNIFFKKHLLVDVLIKKKFMKRFIDVAGWFGYNVFLYFRGWMHTNIKTLWTVWWKHSKRKVLLRKFRFLYISIKYLAVILTRFWPMFPFYTPWKHQKTFGFLVFSGV